MSGLQRRALIGALAAGNALQLRAAPRAFWPVFGSQHYLPLLHLHEGRPAGLLVTLLEEAGQRLGERFAIELQSWPMSVRRAEQGQGGLIGVSYTQDRASWLDYSEPCWHDELRLVVRQERKLRFESLADLHGLRVGMGRRTTAGAAFDEAVAAGRIQVVWDGGAPERLRALLAGRLDMAVVAMGALGLQQALQRQPGLQQRASELVLLPRALTRDALHLAFPKTWQAQTLLSRFNAVLGQLPGRQRL